MDKPRLRNTLKKLRALEKEHAGLVEPVEATQEMLDLLAVLEGVKPVSVVGRGLDHPGWIDGIKGIAQDVGLRVVDGPFWDATPFGEAFPGWYVAHMTTGMTMMLASYICKTQAAERAVRAVGDIDGHVTIEEEARLLGYPECCVAGHYSRALCWHRATMAMLRRRGEDNEETMNMLLVSGVPLAPETEEEKILMEQAYDFRPAPFGSWNMCPTCLADSSGPSGNLALRYRAIAEAADPDLIGRFDS
jgi:hypothetical protein